jgi:hypothetical protein
MHRVTRRIGDQTEDDEDQRQRHQERDRRLRWKKRSMLTGRASARRRFGAGLAVESAPRNVVRDARHRLNGCHRNPADGRATIEAAPAGRRQLRMNPSSSVAAQAMVLSIGSPWAWRTPSWSSDPGCRSAFAIFGGAGDAAIDRV